jgi:hypothetical protein
MHVGWQHLHSFLDVVAGSLAGMRVSADNSVLYKSPYGNKSSVLKIVSYASC